MLGPSEDIKVRQHPTMALTMKPPTMREGQGLFETLPE